VQDIPKSLKNLNKRENGNRLHVIIMTDRGKTGRFTFSTSFFWVMGLLLLFILAALFFLAYRLSALMVLHQSDKLKLEAMGTYYETREFNRSFSQSPQDAGLILERLDQAALMAETIDNQPILPWGVDTDQGSAKEQTASGQVPALKDQANTSTSATDKNAQAPGQGAPGASSQDEETAPGEAAANEADPALAP
jgi:hypothetical protein